MSRSTESDFPALVLRLSVGPMFIIHGTNKVWGAGGLDGTTNWFDGLGFKPAHIHARLAATTEIGAGALMTLGALNPLPSAGVIGLMTVAAQTDHKGKGFFVFKGGWEYTAILSAVAAALAAMGNGRLSVDRLIGNRRRGLKATLMAGILGVANAQAVLAASYRPTKTD
jgi:putative oxidoreductase